MRQNDESQFEYSSRIRLIEFVAPQIESNFALESKNRFHRAVYVDTRDSLHRIMFRSRGAAQKSLGEHVSAQALKENKGVIFLLSPPAKNSFSRVS